MTGKTVTRGLRIFGQQALQTYSDGAGLRYSGAAPETPEYMRSYHSICRRSNTGVMKKRSIKKQFYMNREEAQDLKKKAKGACMPEARLIRLLIAGYAPPPAPDEQFYDAMDLMRKLYERIGQIAGSADDQLTKKLLESEVENWKKFRLAIEKRYLMPERNEKKWL